MSPFPPIWRQLLALSLLLACLAWGLRIGQGEAAKAVPFVFTDIDGRTVRLTDYQGKWVLVSFWAPWCPLCKLLVPNLNTLNQRPDVRVIGVAMDYGLDEGSIRRAIGLARMNFDAFVAGGSRRDPKGAYRQVGPVDYFPTSYLYDPTGEVVMFIPGQLRLNRVLAFMEDWQASRAGAGRAPILAARTEKLAAFLDDRYGERGRQAYADWKRMADTALGLAPAEQLARVNDFFNRRIRVDEDSRIWGRPDYWATPGELLGNGRGDSEDFVIAKYFTLLALRLAPERLRLVYVRTRGEAPEAGAGRASPVHMVLAYYDAPGSDPLILDNRTDALLTAANRPELRPVYSFNSLGVWEETATAAAAGDPKRRAVWEDTLRRAREQGFE